MMSLKNASFVTFAALALAAGSALAASPAKAHRVAVMELRTQKSGAEFAQTLGDLVAFELGESGEYKVLTSDDLKGVLKMKGLQQALGCETEACVTEVGDAVDVQSLVTGMVGRVGGRFVIVLKLLDVKSLSVLKQVKTLLPANEDALLDAIGTTTRTLIAKAPIVRADTAEGMNAMLPSGGGASANTGALGGLGARPVPAKDFGFGSVAELQPGSTALGAAAGGEPEISNEAESALGKKLAKKLAARQAKKTAKAGKSGKARR